MLRVLNPIRIYHSLQGSLISLWVWFPVIWRDRQWDDAFLLLILIHKIRLMRQTVPDWLMENWFDIYREMDYVLQRLQDVESQRYDTAAHEMHSAKWGESVFSHRDLPDRPGWSELLINYPNATTPELEEQSNKELIRLAKEGEARTQKALDEAFEMLAKSLRGWWD